MTDAEGRSAPARATSVSAVESPGARAARWLPDIAVTVTAAAGSMSLLAVVDTAAGPVPPFLFAFPAVALVARAVGFWPAMATAVLCLAWLYLPWMASHRHAGDALALPVELLFLLFAAVVAASVRTFGRPARPARDTAQDSASVRGLQGLLALAVVLPLALYAVLGAHALESTRAETDRRLERVVRAAQENVTRVLDTNEMLLGRVLDLVGELSDDQIRAREPLLHEKVKSITAGLPQLQSLWVQDAEGRPLLSDRFLPAPADRLDVSDRDYFVWHREGRGGLYISEPSIGRVTGEPYFDTSRRRDVGGDFAGIVHVSLKPGYFARFFEDLADAEPSLAITLARRDGQMLARHPPPGDTVNRSRRESPLMQQIASGERRGAVVMPSSFDGRERRIVFRALDGYPLFVGAGVESAAIIAAWHQEMAALAALLFPISAALVGAAWVALQRARREHAALARLRAETDQRLRAEGALLRTQKLQALGQITGSVAHDFNNLLAVVGNSAQLILRRPAGTDAKPQAAAIERAVRNGAHLTRQLLAFSRRQALQPADVDLREMLPRAAELLRTSVSGRIHVELDVAPDVRLVHIDPADLELALLNLVLNARDAMPAGGTVRIEAANDHDRRDVAHPTRHWVEIRVVDGGQGIEPAVLDRVFEPFFTTKEATNGTGLGLSQVRSACEQAGGVALIESRPGVGTTVTLRLPAAARPPPAREPGAVDERLDCSLLVVEDDAEVAATTAALLRSVGATVELAMSAAEALAMLGDANHRFDVVLSDVAMPGSMNGIGLAQHLRRVRPELPVVLMTGFTAELETAVGGGFTVVAKPCTAQALIRAVTQAARRSAPGRGGREPSGQTG